MRVIREWGAGFRVGHGIAGGQDYAGSEGGVGTPQVGEELAATDAGEVQVEQDEIHVLDRLRRNGGEVPLGFDAVGGFHNAPLRALEEAPQGESNAALIVDQ